MKKRCKICDEKTGDVIQNDILYCASCWLKIYARNVRPILNYNPKVHARNIEQRLNSKPKDIKKHWDDILNFKNMDLNK